VALLGRQSYDVPHLHPPLPSIPARSGSLSSHRVASRRRSSPPFTAAQGQYLAFIYAYTTIHRRSPAEADLRRFFGVTAPSVHRMVLALETRGLIRRTPGQARSIELLVPPEALPVLPPHPESIKTFVQRVLAGIRPIEKSMEKESEQ
jgi:DNA-binding MarR family transcriptional regulator